MKQCPQCSGTVPNDLWLCSCGYEFDGSELKTPDPPQPRVAPGMRRLALYLATWSLALLILSRDIRSVVWIWAFPLGLFAPFDLPHGRYEEKLTFYIWTFGGWTLYAIHAFFFFRTTRIPWLIILYACLCIFLICNLSGCQHILHRRIW